jgi:hypothetical protein
MQITPNEIAHVEEAGSLNASPVKLIKTKGGFWIAVAKPRGKIKEEAVAAGSHPAIVRYNLEKQFPDFEPSLMKSEHYNDAAIVDKHSHFLSDDLRKSGHDLYSVQEGTTVSFKITHQNIEKHQASGYMSGRDLIINNISKMDQAMVRAVAGAVAEKALDMKAASVKMESKK